MHLVLIFIYRIYFESILYSFLNQFDLKKNIFNAFSPYIYLQEYILNPSYIHF
jgi:hypothetical protein